MGGYKKIICQRLHVIQLTGSAKNDAKTDKFCSVCSKARNFFSLVESIVGSLVVDRWFFLLLRIARFITVDRRLSQAKDDCQQTSFAGNLAEGGFALFGISI